MENMIPNAKVTRALVGLLTILTLFFIVKIVSSVREMRFIGGGVAPSNVISVSGEGKAFAIPDVATLTFTLQSKGDNPKTAQDAVATQAADVTAKLEELGVAEKDVKTTNYSSTPTYDCSSTRSYPPCDINKITGYEVSEMFEVKVVDITTTASIVQALGDAGVSGLSGPNYDVADSTAVNNEARANAIADAKAKADELAKELGVHIVRIVGFSENNAGPYYYAGKASLDMAMPEAAPLPSVPVGENTVTSNVTITYEIR